MTTIPIAIRCPGCQAPRVVSRGDLVRMPAATYRPCPECRDAAQPPGAACEVAWSSSGEFCAVTVPRCPLLCGGVHLHGGGVDPQRPDLGHRAAHCADDHIGSYELDRHVGQHRSTRPAAGDEGSGMTRQLPFGCPGPERAVRIGHQFHRCAGCEPEAPGSPARGLPPAVDQCVSCGGPLEEGLPNRCALCVRAAQFVLGWGREGVGA